MINKQIVDQLLMLDLILITLILNVLMAKFFKNYWSKLKINDHNVANGLSGPN